MTIWYSDNLIIALRYVDKALRLSPHDPALFNFHEMKSTCGFALKQYEQSIEFGPSVDRDPSRYFFRA